MDTSGKTILIPYLNFMGQTKEAMEFYQSVFGGELTMQSFKEAEFPHEEKDDDKIIHANLMSDEINIMSSDGNDEHPVKMGDNVHLSLGGTDEATLTNYFKALAVGGKIDMDLQKQFWGDIYGQLTDKFGIHWMFNIGVSDKSKE